MEIGTLGRPDIGPNLTQSDLDRIGVDGLVRALGTRTGSQMKGPSVQWTVKVEAIHGAGTERATPM